MNLNEIIFMLLAAPFLWGAIVFGGLSIYYSFIFFPVSSLIVLAGLIFVAIPITLTIGRSRGKN